MIPELRADFNRRWTAARYAEFLQRLDEESGTHVEFRCSETPVFLPSDLLAQMVRYGQELYGQLANNADYRKAAEATIPAEFRVPGSARTSVVRAGRFWFDSFGRWHASASAS